MIVLSWTKQVDQDNRFRLISLREIMEAIDARELVGAGHNLMLFNSLNQILNPLNAIAPSEYNSISTDSLISDSMKSASLVYLGELHIFCERLGLVVTLQKLRRFINKLENSSITVKEFGTDAIEISERLSDELDAKVCLMIDSYHASYYSNYADNWAAVIGRFPSPVRDIEEASKCFALNRYTATVFHLMRIMEVGLRVLAKSLDDSSLNPKTNPTWERILRKCRAELSKPLQERSPEWKADEPFFSGASARLMAIKDAWRNPTMHVEQTYTEETALDVFNHVQAFMRHLATKLYEN
jgi:hypothetical protein